MPNPVEKTAEDAEDAEAIQHYQTFGVLAGCAGV
jgi:hypothetical protein